MKPARHLCLLLLSGVMFSSGRAEVPPEIDWQRTYGGTNTDYLYGLTEAAQGGYVLVGSSYSGASGNKSSTSFGDYDAWVLRVDAKGAKIWESSFGGTNTDSVVTVRPTGDGGFVLVGTTFSGVSGNRTNAWNGSADGWVIKLDGGGNRLWERCFGGSSLDVLSDVRTNSSGGYLLCGSPMSGISGNKTSPNYGWSDAWVVNLDGDGNKIWEQSFGGTAVDGAGSLEVTDDGGCIFCGGASSGVSGNKTSPNYGAADYWIVKLDASGNKQWEKTFGGSQSDNPAKLLRTSDGGYIVAGSSSSGVSGNKTSPNYGGTDFWVIKLDANGNKIWENSFGGSANDDLRALALTRDGGYLLGGNSASPVSGNKTSPNFGGIDYWIVKLDATGSKVWEQSFGGTGDDNFYALQQAADNGFILGGYSISPVSGNKTCTNYGGVDF